MKRPSQSGVTLIEVLIAVTLLSILSVAMLIAMRVGLQAFSKTDTKLLQNRRVAGAQRILEQELEGMLPAIVPCTGKNEPNGMKFVLFQAEAQSLRLVSTFSLQQAWRGQPQVLEMFVIAGNLGKGVRLVVNESPYAPFSAGKVCTDIGPDPLTGKPGVRFTPISPTPRSFVLADQLAYCRFSYLVPPQTADQKLPRWQPTATGLGWPLAVRIEMAPLEPDPSRLQPITLTAPIFIRRAPEIEYGDY